MTEIMFGINQTTHDGIETKSPREVLAVFLAARQAGDDDMVDSVTSDREGARFRPLNGGVTYDIVEIYDMEDDTVKVGNIRDDVLHINPAPEEMREGATVVGAKIESRAGGMQQVAVGWVKDGRLI